MKKYIWIVKALFCNRCVRVRMRVYVSQTQRLWWRIVSFFYHLHTTYANIIKCSYLLIFIVFLFYSLKKIHVSYFTACAEMMANDMTYRLEFNFWREWNHMF